MLAIPVLPIWGQVVFSGDKIFNTQQDIEDFFAVKPYTSITGDVTFDPTTGFSDLGPFSDITLIGGTLTFINFTPSDPIDPLDAFSSLTEVGGLTIGTPGNGNDFEDFLFPEYEGLSSDVLTTINGDLIVQNNATFMDLSMSALQSISGSFVVTGSPLFESFGFSPSLTSIGQDLQIVGSSIGDLDGLLGITSVGGDIILNGNSDLTSLTGLENLATAASLSIIDNDNASFTDLSELGSLTTLTNSLTITGNASLSDCSQLPCQVTVGGSDFNTVNNDNVIVSGNTGDCLDKDAIQAVPEVNSRECVQLALPVELLSFTGSLEGGEVALAWSTATEVDNSHFFVERSVDGFTYAAIGRVEGAGTVGYITDYRYTDEDFAAGVNYYRLRQVDFDGAETLSNVIAIDAGAVTATLGLYPNPVGAGEVLNVQVGSALGSQSITAEVFSAGGRLVGQQSWLVGDKLQLTTAGLNPGLYVVRLSNGQRTVTERVVIR